METKKRLRLLISLMTVLVMAMSLAGCGVLDKVFKKTSNAGYYEFVNMKDSSSTITAEELEEYGFVTYLLLNEDGTGEFVVMSEVDEITWTSDAIKNSDGESVSYTVEDGILTMSDSEYSFEFKKSNGTPPVITTEEATDDEPDTEVEELDDPDRETEEATEAPESDEKPAETSSSGDFTPVEIEIEGQYLYRVVGAEQFEDYDGKTAVRFYYDFTNNSDETLSAYYNSSTKAEQEGYELVNAYTYDEAVDEVYNSTRKVRPGVTIRCVDQYNFKPDGGELVFILGEYYDDENALKVTFDPANLPGRPAELEVQTFEEPDWTSDLVDAGELNNGDYYVSIDDAEIIEDGDESMLRVYYTFTNNSEEAEYPWVYGEPTAYQDGMELDKGYPSSTLAVTEDDNDSTELEPGGTIQCTAIFELKTSNPVEVEVSDFYDAKYGAMFLLEE